MERLTTTKRRLTTLSSSRRAALERAKRTLAERGPPVGETDDLDRDEPYDHQRRSQLKELIANTIMSMVTLYNGNYRPVLALHDEPFPGLTGARPDATRLYADKEEEFTPQDISDPEFSSYAGLFHRICWECDEGKDPHGNGPNYSEYNECSRGLRYVDIIDVDNPVVLLVLVVLPSPSRAWDGRTSVDVPPHSLTHSLTHPLTHSLTHPLTPSLQCAERRAAHARARRAVFQLFQGCRPLRLRLRRRRLPLAEQEQVQLRVGEEDAGTV